LALIGVFDSGVGGLSILDEALRQLPEHNYIYLADSINAPYGERSSEWIANRTMELCQYLAAQGCDAIMVACNTATAEAIANIRHELSNIPIIGVEPGIKPAAMQSSNGIVGVLATEATLKSDKFSDLLATLPNCQFVKQAGAGLVPLIEAGQANSEETLELLAQHLEPIQEAGADTLVLGCTHYPFLRKAIRKLLGDSINLIDTSEAVVRQLKRKLESQEKHLDHKESGSIKFISSKDAQKLHHMARELMQSDLDEHSIQSQVVSSFT
jgi:glutamate racemase